MKQVYPWIMDRLPLLMYEKNIVLFIDFPSELRFKNESQRILFGEDIIFSFKEYYG